MASETKHTPGPWVIHVIFNGRGSSFSVGREETGTDHTVAKVSALNGRPWSAEANAAFIVRAVNCHDDMLAALQEIDASEAAYEGDAEDDERCRKALAAARAAIAKATL